LDFFSLLLAKDFSKNAFKVVYLLTLELIVCPSRLFLFSEEGLIWLLPLLNPLKTKKTSEMATAII
jgi:hypothetical protein